MPDQVVIPVAGILAGVSLLIALVKWIIPACKAVYRFCSDVAAFFYVWGGRGPSVDPVTGEALDAVDPLPVVLGKVRKELSTLDDKVSDQGQALSDLTSVVQQVVDQKVVMARFDTRLTAVETTSGENQAAISALIANAIERGGDAAMSAAERTKPEFIDGEEA